MRPTTLLRMEARKLALSPFPLKKLGKVTVEGDPVLEFVGRCSLLVPGRRYESELRDKLNRGRDSQQSERRLARKHSVDYRVVRDAIEDDRSSF